jgi:hypothetical protein
MLISFAVDAKYQSDPNFRSAEAISSESIAAAHDLEASGAGVSRRRSTDHHRLALNYASEDQEEEEFEQEVADERAENSAR